MYLSSPKAESVWPTEYHHRAQISLWKESGKHDLWKTWGNIIIERIRKTWFAENIRYPNIACKINSYHSRGIVKRCTRFMSKEWLHLKQYATKELMKVMFTCFTIYELSCVFRHFAICWLFYTNSSSSKLQGSKRYLLIVTFNLLIWLDICDYVFQR